MGSYTYEDMPIGVEISENNRAKCRKCFRKVMKGLPRGVLISVHTMGWKGAKLIHYGNAYICNECLYEGLDFLKKRITYYKKEHRKLNNKKSVKATKLVLALEPREDVGIAITRCRPPIKYAVGSMVTKINHKGGIKWKKKKRNQ